jgi:hypothetical protein
MKTLKEVSRTKGIEKMYPSTKVEYTLEQMQEFNEAMEDIRRESILRQHRSFISAVKVIFNA